MSIYDIILYWSFRKHIDVCIYGFKKSNFRLENIIDTYTYLYAYTLYKSDIHGWVKTELIEY